MKLKPFQKDRIVELLSWIENLEDQHLWSGNTFQAGLNEEIFSFHLKRKDLYSFSFLENELLSYGEIVKTKDNNGVLCRVIVNPRLRKRGIGQNFINQILNWAFKQKFLKKITLNTFGHNHTAIKCYQSLGFNQIKYRRKFRLVGNDWKDLVIMEKKATEKRI